MIKKIFIFISDQRTILCTFLAFFLFGLISFVVDKDSGNIQSLPYQQHLILKLLSFFTYAVLAFFTYKGIKIIRWVMAVIILLSGIPMAAGGLFGIEWDQYFLKPFAIVFGLYFVFGGISLFRLKIIKNESS